MRTVTARYMVDYIRNLDCPGPCPQEFVVVDMASRVHGGIPIVAVHSSLARAARKAMVLNRIHTKMIRATRRLGVAAAGHDNRVPQELENDAGYVAFWPESRCTP